MKPYYETPNGILYNANCLEILADCKNIDLVITSPPYGGLRNYKGYDFDFIKISNALYAALKPGGVVVWVVGDETIKGSESGESFRQALYFKEIGFNLHDTMIYDKNGMGGCKGSKYAYWSGFDYMFIFVKGKIKVFNPICDRINKHGGNVVQSRSRKKDGTMTSKRIVQVANRGRRFNVWQIEQSSKQKHPAAFPEALARDHILSWCTNGDMVLDPMCGSGTVPKMCEKLNRKWVACEISEEYCEMASYRIARASSRLGN